MNRRNFAKKTVLAAAGAAFLKAGSASAATADELRKLGSKPFKCKFAPNIYTWTNIFPFATKGLSDPDKISFFYDLGFRAYEDNDMFSRPIETQKAMAARMEKLGIEMGTFTSYNGMKDTFMTANRENRKSPTDKKAAIERTKKIMTEMMEVAKRVNAKWTTVVPGMHDDTTEYAYQFENVADHLSEAAKICEKAGVIMVLEPLSFTKHPNLWLKKIADAYALCRRVGSANCKILFDVFHQQETEGSLIRNMNLAWSEIAYFHLGDSPYRTEPGSGEINFKSVIKHAYDKGYRGIYGMEHKLSDKSEEGEIKMMKAYREIDVS